MKIGVVGLWHLGLVTAAGLSSLNFSVTGYDPDEKSIAAMRENKLPIAEPGLDDLVRQGIDNHTLFFTHNAEDLSTLDFIWVTFDTPVDENDHADFGVVVTGIEKIIPYLKQNAIILISSQLPIGSTQKVKQFCEMHYPKKNILVGYSPENLRLGKALDIFLNQDRIILGGDDRVQKAVAPVLNRLTTQIIGMSIESAEMTKHALNAFLANSIVFINEIATLCEYTGADATEVSRGLKSESRIGPRAYLQPGAAIAGGTLLRDVTYLHEIASEKKLFIPLISNILESNKAHKQWVVHKLKTQLTDLNHKKIVIAGLSYKLGTDTLRRSISVEIAKLLQNEGAVICAFDPDIQALSDELNITLEKEMAIALHQADALIILKNMPALSEARLNDDVSAMKNLLVFDPNGYAQNNLQRNKQIRYYTMGKSCQ